MKSIFLTILIIVMIVLLGTWPLTILAKLFEILSTVIMWLAKALNIFGWNGIL
ncbi:MAG: hypothetical protein IJB10_03000 [Clostridia bacterium]|nr:hypothetical protein [Clostridia bacterium]